MVRPGNSPFSSSFLKIGSNFGTKKTIRTFRTMEPMTARKIGIGHGADDLGLEVFLVLGEVGDAAEHVFEEAAFLAGADHADGQFVEGARMLGHGVGQAGAVGDLGADLAQDLRQRGLGALPFENFQAAQQRHAGVQQVGQLRIEGGQDARLDLRPAALAPGRRRLRRPRCASGTSRGHRAWPSTSRSLLAVSVPWLRLPVLARAS